MPCHAGVMGESKAARWGLWAGLIAFVLLTYALYAWVRRRAAKV